MPAVEEADAAEVDAAESLAAVEDVRGAETEPSAGAESDDAVDAEAEPVDAGPAAPVDEDEDVAEIAVVEDLAEALGLDGPVAPAFDVDGPDDSGEAAVAYAGSKLATPPPGLAEGDLVPTLEAILLVVDEPVSELTLAEVLEVPAELIAGTLIDLSAQYTRESRGFDLRRAAGGWRLYTRAEYAPYVERFVLDGQQLRLTQASLETLAVVAYKQPVTRSRISAIRGVNCDGVIRTLVTRGMIEECGTEPESGAYLYRTTSLFLEKLGLDSVDQLPPLAPFLPDNVEEIADEQR
ncbi:SMC-Scp complex subunit ScpB [Catellatospora citrea]